MSSDSVSTTTSPANLSPDLVRLIEARQHDPFSVLGRHPTEAGDCIRALLPEAERVLIGEAGEEMTRVPGTDLFEWRGAPGIIAERYRLTWETKDGQRHSDYDPYCFPPLLADFDLHLFGEGRHWHAYRFLGAHVRSVDGVSGVHFAVWAPNAERLSVVGDFNRWDGRRHPMVVRGGSGVWELFIPGLGPDTLYKYEVRNRQHGTIHVKSDPYARRFELRPGTACLVPADTAFQWQDDAWIEQRQRHDWQRRPMSIYEVHLGSWQRDGNGQFLDYRSLAERLVRYVTDLGFTHIELMPVTEHPLDASWGYQTVGYYAPTSRFGTPDAFRYFVDYCHRHGVGVLMDWAPGHFPKDAHGLARFDGTPLYEHEDPRLGEHRDWGTLIYNYGRSEVKNFLLSNALYWMDEFHIDGLRVDAVASMLYLDYSREADDWVPNIYGGRENLEAIEFLRQLNQVTHAQHPGTVMIAEESTAWPQVTRPTWLGGLGFSMKWNMGWMHDTLEYFGNDPIYRHYHHDRLTFGLLYAFTENFVLPFSHDEVVHGKASMLHKMPGDDWQRFANLRLLYAYMYTYPGKKLLFMGSEFGQRSEWNFDTALEWQALDNASHHGVLSLVRDLNRLYVDAPALHRHDFEPEGFDWIDCHDAAQSVISYLRRADDELLVTVLNFTPVPRTNYRLGVPEAGRYREVLNSDSQYYDGTNMGNAGNLQTQAKPWMGREQSLVLTLPPLAGIVLRFEAS